MGIFSNFIQKEKLVYYTFSPKNIKKIPGFEPSKVFFHGKIDLLTGLKDANIRAFFVQVKNTKTPLIGCFLRSISRIDVSKIARKYGGGGHKDSAGIEIQ